MNLIKVLVLFFIFACASGLFAQVKSKMGTKPENFVPTHWTIKDKIVGDLNGDTLTDMALIIDSPDGERRLLLILDKQKDGKLKLANQVEEIALCASCGGVFGDPYDSGTIKNGILTIHNYGGSADRWAETFKIRYIQGSYKLIGYTSNQFSSIEACKGKTVDYNSVTGKVQLTKESVAEKSKGADAECHELEKWTTWDSKGSFELKNRASWKLPGIANFSEFFGAE